MNQEYNQQNLLQTQHSVPASDHSRLDIKKTYIFFLWKLRMYLDVAMHEGDLLRPSQQLRAQSLVLRLSSLSHLRQSSAGSGTTHC